MSEQLAIAAAALLAYAPTRTPTRWSFERGRAGVLPVTEGHAVCVTHDTFRLVGVARGGALDVRYFEGSFPCAIWWTQQLAATLDERRRAQISSVAS